VVSARRQRALASGIGRSTGLATPVGAATAGDVERSAGAAVGVDAAGLAGVRGGGGALPPSGGLVETAVTGGVAGRACSSFGTSGGAGRGASAGRFAVFAAVAAGGGLAARSAG
jgi:hypothetical protein